jgi:FAD/FMN-containing dehydrogenase
MRSTSEFAHAAVEQAAAGNRSARSILNDVHARLNPAVPALQRRPDSLVALRSSVEQARRRGLGISIAGGRHAMGGQQFLQGGMALDMRGMNRILDFDQEAGLITVEAGATWPELMRGYLSRQAGNALQ